MKLDQSAKYLDGILGKIGKAKNAPNNLKIQHNGTIAYSIKRFAFPGRIENKNDLKSFKETNRRQISGRKIFTNNHNRNNNIQLKTFTHFNSKNKANMPNELHIHKYNMLRTINDTKRSLIDINNYKEPLSINQDLSTIYDKNQRFQNSQSLDGEPAFFYTISREHPSLRVQKRNSECLPICYSDKDTKLSNLIPSSMTNFACKTSVQIKRKQFNCSAGSIVPNSQHHPSYNTKFEKFLANMKIECTRRLKVNLNDKINEYK